MLLPASAFGPEVGPVQGAFGLLYSSTTALASETESASAADEAIAENRQHAGELDASH